MFFEFENTSLKDELTDRQTNRVSAAFLLVYPTGRQPYLHSGVSKRLSETNRWRQGGFVQLYTVYSMIWTSRYAVTVESPAGRAKMKTKNEWMDMEMEKEEPCYKGQRRGILFSWWLLLKDLGSVTNAI